MACNCNQYVRSSSTSTTSTDDCICVPSVIKLLCSDGPEPCSSPADTFTYDLSQHLDNDVCSSVSWELRSYDSLVFPDMAIDANGELTTSVVGGTGGQEYIIIYRVGCTDYRVDGELHICLRDMCVGVECDEGFVCDPCDGSCVEEESDLEAI